MTLFQIWGIAKYEFKMHWRRRALLIIMISITLIVVSPILINGEISELTDTVGIAQENIDRALSVTVALVTWVPMSVVLIFVLPVAVADTIPLDKQHNVDELLRTTTLSPAAYLWGKLIGMWLAVFAGLAVVMVVVTLTWLSQVQGFDYGLYAEIWFVNVIAITILNGSLGVLLAVGQPNRRRAVVVVIGLFIALMLVLSVDFGEFWELGSPIRLPMLTYFIPNENEGELITTVFNRPIMLTIGIGLIELVLIWLAAWGWLKYQQDRA